MSTDINFEYLENLVIEWANEREILKKSNPRSQLLKTMSEVGELADAVNQGDHIETIASIGDVLVTLIILSELEGLSVVDCLHAAYSEIEDRTGKMIVCSLRINTCD